ncbi:hypothetical protein D3C71_1773450 [compost metagenome]
MINKIFVHDQSDIEEIKFDILNRELTMKILKYNESSDSDEEYIVCFDAVSNVEMFNVEYLQQHELTVSHCEYTEGDERNRIKLILLQGFGMTDFEIGFEFSTIRYVID